MAVTEIIETHEGRRGRDEVTGIREYERVFKVITNSIYDGPLVVKNAFGIPRFGQFYKTDGEEDQQAFLVDKNADQIDDSKLAWLVTCTFSTRTDNGNGGLELPVEPLNQSSTLEWGFVEYREIATEGFSTDTDRWESITNSALDPFDPPIEKDAARLALRIGRNEANFDPLLAAKYANVVNSDDWIVLGRVFKAWSALMKPPRAVYRNQRGQGYWEVQYEIHFAAENWVVRILDTGDREFLTQAEADLRNGRIKSYNQGAKKPVRADYVAGYNKIRNGDGTHVTEPVLLDGKGHAAVVPGLVADLQNIVPEKRFYRLYPALPFGALRLT